MTVAEAHELARKVHDAHEADRPDPFADVDAWYFEDSVDDALEVAEAEEKIALAALFGPFRTAKLALAYGLTPGRFSTEDNGAVLGAILKWYRDAADLFIIHGQGLKGDALFAFARSCVGAMVREELVRTSPLWWTETPNAGAPGAWHRGRVIAAMNTRPDPDPYSHPRELADLMAQVIATAGRREAR